MKAGACLGCVLRDALEDIFYEELFLIASDEKFDANDDLISEPPTPLPRCDSIIARVSSAVWNQLDPHIWGASTP